MDWFSDHSKSNLKVRKTNRTYRTKTWVGRRFKRSRCCKVHQQPKPQYKIPIHRRRIPKHNTIYILSFRKFFLRFPVQITHAPLEFAALQNVADADWLTRRQYDDEPGVNKCKCATQQSIPPTFTNFALNDFISSLTYEAILTWYAWPHMRDTSSCHRVRGNSVHSL